MKQQLAVGSLVTVIKKADPEMGDGLNKFAGWEATVLEYEPGKEVTITHPFGLNDVTEPFKISADRLKILGKPKAEAKKPASKAPSKNDLLRAVMPGDKLKIKNANLVVSKAAAANSTTILAFNANGKEVRIWRDKLVEISSK